MAAQITLGEQIRRLRKRKRWQLQNLADETGLSPTHLSRIENDSAVPNADTVVKLHNALGGDLTEMLKLADCLPQEILERLARRADVSAPALHRSSGVAEDPTFAHDLVDDLDPAIRTAIITKFDLSEDDVSGIFEVLHQLGTMAPAQRRAFIELITRGLGGA